MDCGQCQAVGTTQEEVIPIVRHKPNAALERQIFASLDCEKCALWLSSRAQSYITLTVVLHSLHRLKLLVEQHADDARHIRDVDFVVIVGIGIKLVERVLRTTEEVTDECRHVTNTKLVITVHVTQQCYGLGADFIINDVRRSGDAIISVMGLDADAPLEEWLHTFKTIYLVSSVREMRAPEFEIGS